MDVHGLLSIYVHCGTPTEHLSQKSKKKPDSAGVGLFRKCLYC